MRFNKVLLSLTLLLAAQVNFLSVEAMPYKNNAESTDGTLAHISVLLLLPGQAATGNSADGLGAYFNEAFTDEIGDEDSYKYPNPDENIGILRNGSVLSLEGRKLICTTDTLQLKMWKLYKTQYELKIEVGDFPSNVRVRLQDAYLNTTIEIANNTESVIPFTINPANAASISATRFRFVLTTFNTLPVELRNIKAFEVNKGVEVNWTSENESNINRYEIEQSANGQSFATVGTVQAKNNSSAATSYSWFDVSAPTTTKYYRVKSYDKSGETKFSSVIKIQPLNTLVNICVAQNQGNKNAINVYFKNSSKGKYNVMLVNQSGQSIYSGSIYNNGGTSNQVITVNNNLAAGIYQLLLNQNDNRKNVAVFIQ
ncbi:MAG TPA: hypothetical protein VF623_12955 [Segetibacter sp.]|jgi:hypothetical protein